jgi:hypothetical protein
MSLDIGSCVSASTSEIFLCIVRYISRLYSFILFLLAHIPNSGHSLTEQHKHHKVRGFAPSLDQIQILKKGKHDIQCALYGPVIGLLFSWIRERLRTVELLTQGALQDIADFIDEDNFDGYDMGKMNNSSQRYNTSINNDERDDYDEEFNTFQNNSNNRIYNSLIEQRKVPEKITKRPKNSHHLFQTDSNRLSCMYAHVILIYRNLDENGILLFKYLNEC